MEARLLWKPGFYPGGSLGGDSHAPDGTYEITMSQSQVSSRAWHHVVYRHGNGLADDFLDGTRLESSTLFGHHQKITPPIWIGRSPIYGNGESFLGQIDDVRIYNRPLSAAEVKALYDYESHAKVMFSEFALNQLDLKYGGEVSGNDSYHLVGSFVLGQDSDGVDLVAEDAVITVGPKKITLPAGTLSKQGNAYSWQGNMDGAQMAVMFDDRGAGAFGFDIRATTIDLSGVVNPVVVQLQLGNDLGKTTNRLTGELHLPQPPDTTPPQITVAGKPIVLWPPNGNYCRIQVSDFVLSVTDAEDKTLSREPTW